MGTVDVRKELGAAIREHRLSLGLSQETLAERAELHRTYVTDIERGARNISLESISKLARALEVSIATLFGAPRQPLAAPDCAVSDILVAESSFAELELTLRAIKQTGVLNPVKVVRDGETALAQLLGREGEIPALLLLDLKLTRLSALEVLARLQAQNPKPPVRVVLLSAPSQQQELQEAVRLGADGVLLKPVQPQAFSALIPALNLHWMLLAAPAAQGADRLPQ